MCHLFAGLLALRVDPVPQLLEAGSHGGLSSGAGRRVRGRASHCGVDWGTHPGRSLRRGAGGVSTRTKARGTAMTGVGCSAPTLATVAVERPLLYDALMLVDEQTNAGPSGRGASLGASGVSHGMSGAAHRIRRGHCGPAGLCGRPRSVASNPNVGEAGTHSPLENLADDRCRSCLRFRPRDSHSPTAHRRHGHRSSETIPARPGNLDLSEQPGPLHIPTRVRHRRVEN